jgi:hypothetical protein
MLKMDPSENALGRAGQVVLREWPGNAVRSITFELKGFQEKPSFIAKWPWLNNLTHLKISATKTFILRALSIASSAI